MIPTLTALTYEPGMVVAEGGLVMVHGRYTFGFGPQPDPNRRIQVPLNKRHVLICLCKSIAETPRYRAPRKLGDLPGPAAQLAHIWHIAALEIRAKRNKVG